MLKKKIILLLLLLPLLANGEFVKAENRIQTVSVQSRALDQRAQLLQAYLAKYNSPLQYHAQDFVDAADEHNLDWKLVAAIAGVESTFGKFIPGGTTKEFTSYNAWGWGVYGNQAIYFKSWREGIFTVSLGLSKNYFSRGYKDPYSINKMYSASPAWGSKVTYFLKDMERFEKQQGYLYNSLENNSLGISVQTAGPSGILALH